MKDFNFPVLIALVAAAFFGVWQLSAAAGLFVFFLLLLVLMIVDEWMEQNDR